MLVINNSIAAPDGGRAWQGVLHTAAIANPADEHRRVINSTMTAAAEIGAPDAVSPEEIADFITTSVVRRRG